MLHHCNGYRVDFMFQLFALDSLQELKRYRTKGFMLFYFPLLVVASLSIVTT